MPEGIVTLADANYFPGLMTLVQSVQESHAVPVTCFDIGLTPAQIEHAARACPQLRIRPLPALADIERTRCAFIDSDPLKKPGKRIWPLWICPFLIAASGYRRVFWLDADLVVLRDLDQLFSQLEQGPVFTTENNAPEHTANQAALYQCLPIDRAFDPSQPCANAGVSGWDLVRDAEILQDYMRPIRRAWDDLAVRAAISWHDQGALIWAIQRHALEHRVLADRRWNLCVRHSPVGQRTYRWGPEVIEQLRRDEPDAAIVHWNGRRVPWM